MPAPANPKEISPAPRYLPINCCAPKKVLISSAKVQLQKKTANLQDLTAYRQKRLKLTLRPVWSLSTRS
ncbi:hypothetical protein DPMN_100013 [Dreissena polymorpha]|uniref:Uncharacterized protein n=1 Tax=Dreissena polymorpha TaxID=45954 RepID=A0A9D4LG20_DREPO|nr:hypothetical protein DPMN_100013 [Dreissena polymorpha]